MLNIGTQYSGYKIIDANDPNVANLYADKTINWFDLLENQYLIIVNEDGNVLDKFKWQDGKHKTTVKKPIDNGFFGKIKPKNIEQELAIDALMDETTTVKVLTGGFGSGKTFLGCACAFQMLQNANIQKIMWIRNNIEVKDSNPIGHLKGTFTDKMTVWAMPLADHIGGKEMLELNINKGLIEIEHLGFLRGRDIKHTLIFCSEAEHLTREHVQLLLGRVGEGSILLLEGDCRQIDAKAFEKDNGLEAAIELIKGNRLFSYVHLNESVRSETAKLADLLNKPIKEK